MENRKRSSEATDRLLEQLEDRQLLKWYRRWGSHPWRYALLQPWLKLPFVLAYWMLFRWNKEIRPLLEHPKTYLLERGPFLLAGYALLAMIFYFAWKQKAFTFFMKSGLHSHWPQPDGDDPLTRSARKTAERLPLRYRRWGEKKWELMACCALGAVLLGIGPLYLLNALRSGEFSWALFVEGFENGYALLLTLAGIFLLFGLLLGYSVARQLRENYHLLATKTAP